MREREDFKMQLNLSNYMLTNVLLCDYQCNTLHKSDDIGDWHGNYAGFRKHSVNCIHTYTAHKLSS